MSESIRNVARLVVSFTAVAFVFAATSLPGKLFVNEHGEVTSALSKLQSTVRGKAFWESQRSIALKELHSELKQPEYDAKLRAEIEGAKRDMMAILRDVQRDDPSLRSSAKQLQAEALREKASQIEQQELDRLMETKRIQRIAELRAIIAALDSKLQ